MTVHVPRLGVSDPGSLRPSDHDRLSTSTFSDLLRAQTGEDLVVDVVSVDQRRADPAAAHVLQLPPGALVHRRRAGLRGSRTRRVHAWAESTIAAQRLPPELRSAAVLGSLPLGDVLTVADRSRDLLAWCVAPSGPHWVDDEVSSPPAPGPTLTRTTRIGGPTGPVAVVTEWWQAGAGDL